MYRAAKMYAQELSKAWLTVVVRSLCFIQCYQIGQRVTDLCDKYVGVAALWKSDLK